MISHPAANKCCKYQHRDLLTLHCVTLSTSISRYYCTRNEIHLFVLVILISCPSSSSFFCSVCICWCGNLCLSWK